VGVEKTYISAEEPGLKPEPEIDKVFPGKRANEDGENPSDFAKLTVRTPEDTDTALSVVDTVALCDEPSLLITIAEPLVGAFDDGNVDTGAGATVVVGTTVVAVVVGGTLVVVVVVVVVAGFTSMVTPFKILRTLLFLSATIIEPLERTESPETIVKRAEEEDPSL